MITRRRNLSFSIAALCVLTFAVGAIAWQTSLAQTKNYEEEFHREIENALAEIDLPIDNNQQKINQAAHSLADFIFYRSGVQLSAANRDALRELEIKSWQQSKRINRGLLIRILTDVAVERISNATDADLDYVGKTLKGFDAPDAPTSDKTNRYLVLRSSGANWVEENEFHEQAKVLRDTVGKNKIAQSFVALAVDREVTEKIEFLVKASPKRFAASRTDLTPAQALLVIYAVVTDDLLAGDKKQLQEKMEALYKTATRISNQPYPSPQGRRAYGANGYFFSTPADFLLNDATVAKLLQAIKEKSKIE